MTLSFVSITDVHRNTTEACPRPRDGLPASAQCCHSAEGAVRVDRQHPRPRDGEEWVPVTQTHVCTWPLPSC